MTPGVHGEEDENDHLEGSGTRPAVSGIRAPIDPTLPTWFSSEKDIAFGSALSGMAAIPELLDYNFEENEAPSPDGRLGCFILFVRGIGADC